MNAKITTGTAAALTAIILLQTLLPIASQAAPGEDAGGGSISWIMVSSVLVFMMIPGAAFFYGGMLRKQSMSSIMAQSLMCCGILGMMWFICGYSLAFGGDGPIIGDLSRLFMEGALEGATGGEVSEMQFALFQMMFQMLTAMLMVGAFAERIRFTSVCWFLVLWSVFVYVPMAHWVWGGGLFDRLFTVLDFAGGTVIHICAGVSGAAVVMYAGARRDYIRTARAHNITLAYIGAMMLWIGWMGFNGGSGMHADGQAVRAILSTNIAAMSAMVVWSAVQYCSVGRVTVLGLITGAIAGMVAVTPQAGYIHPWAGLVFGAAGALVCYFAVRCFHGRRRFDDALDVFAVHGCGGIAGALLTGVFATSEYAPCDGLLYGSVDLLLGEAASVLISVAFCFTVSYGIIWLLGKVTAVRVPKEEETVGPDIAEHGEPAYYREAIR